MNDRPRDILRPLARRAARLAVVALGVALSQFILYGPSLTGQKVLLPLDLLAQPGVYLPLQLGQRLPQPHNSVRTDLIYFNEPGRQFESSELHAGRWPLWNPYQFTGVPSRAATYSPYWWLRCGVQSPVVLAWVEMLAALVAAFGMYAFCRSVLRVGYWPAVFVAWCYPLTGFFIFWQGYGLAYGAAWLPWMLLAVDKTVRQAGPWAGPGLALATALVVADGRPDIAGEVLLASGIYALWCYFDCYGRQWLSRHALKSLAFASAGWLLGFLLVAGFLLPLVEYTMTGARMMRRSKGEEERPPVGLVALPQTVLPDMYGSTQAGDMSLFEIRFDPDGQRRLHEYPEGQGNQLESSAATYSGLLATLLVAPLGWSSRRRRSINLLWLGLGVLGLAWVLDIPLLVDLMRMPGLNMLSHNRSVFVTSFSLLAMAAAGLDVLRQGELRWRWWFLPPALVTATLLGWCLYRSVVPPEPVATLLETYLAQGLTFPAVADLAGLRRVQMTFMQHYALAAVLSALALAGWLVVLLRVRLRGWSMPLAGLLLLADLLWFAYGRNEQCEWSLYYPRIPVLEEVAADAEKTSGRIMGVGCFPPALSEMRRLRDVRGYDAVDPARLIDLMGLEGVVNPHSTVVPYALTQLLIPQWDIRPPGIIRLHPVLDMLGVRYVIFRGAPPTQQGIRPDFSGPDYWVLENNSALPRVYVPERVETIADDQERLRKMASPQFDPRQVAYVETPLASTLPETCRGSASIVEEIPRRITISLDMETPGVVVLADLWDKGWRAYLDGRPAPILRANHAVRGVEVPAGKATLEFRYQPASLAWGLGLSVAAGLATLAWLVIGYRFTPAQMPPAPASPQPPAKKDAPQGSQQPGRSRDSKRRRKRRP